MLTDLAAAFEVIANLQGLTVILAGASIGLVFGMLPGLGASQAMILLLPFTYGMDSELAIVLFISIMATSTFGGSLPAILLNTPGTPANVVTTLDGYPMAMRGEANRAIAISAAACAVGTVVGALVLLSSIPVLRALISAFHAQERFWLIVFGLATISLASKGNAVKGLVAGGVGVLISFVGRNYVFPGERFTGGFEFLYDGIPLAAFLVGVFAVAPMLVIGSRDTVVTTTDASGAVQVGQSGLAAIRAGFCEVYRHRVQAIRGSIVGVALGIVPAVGGAAAAFINYFMSKQFTRSEREFGTGAAEGLIASETANDAKDGGTLMPTLSFGIPGDPNTAVLLGALLMHGVPLGYNLFENHRSLVLEIVVTLVVAQLVVSILGLSVSRIVSKLTLVNTSYIVPLVFAFSLLGAYLFRGNGWDLVVVVFAALLSYGMTRNNYPPISLVLGYLLGQEAERNFMMSLRQRDFWVPALLDSWISWVLIGVIVLTFAASAIMTRRAERRQERDDKPSDGAVGTTDGAEETPEARLADREREGGLTTKVREQTRSLEATAFGVMMLLFVGAFGVASMTYARQMRLFPLLITIFCVSLLLLVIAAEHSATMSRWVERLGGGMQALSDNGEAANGESVRRQMRIAVGLAAFVGLTVAAGFLVMPVLLALYTKVEGRRPWFPTLVIGGLLFAAVFSMAAVPGVRFWPGAIPEIIPGIVGGGRLPI